MNTIEGLRRTALAAASAAAAMLALAGSAHAQMVTGASGFNGGYNNADGARIVLLLASEGQV